jgi:membrane-bound serine protease (ClpP class)
METLYSEPLSAFLFVVVGFILLFLEVFIPSGGILGILATLSTLFGVFGLFHQKHPVWGSVTLLGFAAYGIWILRFVIKRLSFKGMLTPRTSTSVDQRLTETPVESRGLTVTPLRPSGVAIFNGKRVDVVSIGRFIEKDRPVRVIETSGNRVVVQEIR